MSTTRELLLLCRPHDPHWEEIFCEELARDHWLLHLDGPDGLVQDCTICTSTREALETVRNWLSKE